MLNIKTSQVSKDLVEKHNMKQKASNLKRSQILKIQGNLACTSETLTLVYDVTGTIEILPYISVIPQAKYLNICG